MIEHTLQSQCIKYLKSVGIYFINVHGGGWSGKGAPDLIVCLDGDFVAFELKVGNNNLSISQKIHHDLITKNNGKYFTPRSLDEFITTITKIKKR
jgi:hypothetical protein